MTCSRLFWINKLPGVRDVIKYCLKCLIQLISYLELRKIWKNKIIKVYANKAGYPKNVTVMISFVETSWTINEFEK